MAKAFGWFDLGMYTFARPAMQCAADGLSVVLPLDS